MDESGMKRKVLGQWADGFLVRRMSRHDAKQVIAWFNDVCPTSVDLDVVLQALGDDADAFYVGELHGQMIASIVRCPVADGLVYGSLFYVDEKHRNSGFGGRIKQIADDEASHCIVALDSHAELEAMNQRRGFRSAFNLTLYVGKVLPDNANDLGKVGTVLKQIEDDDFARMMSYDDKCFIRAGSTWRRQLMSRWITIPGGRAVMALSNHGDVVGYGCRRPSVDAETRDHLIGPLYADSYDIARHLMHALTADIVGMSVSVNICECHKEAMRLVSAMKLKDSLHMVRVYRNGDPGQLSDRVFAVTSIDVCGF